MITSIAPVVDGAFVWATQPSPSPAARFTLDGSAMLEQHLSDACKSVLTGISRIIPERKLEGIALGGGYGRGEGGVLKTVSGDKPYNDLEFYIFVRGHSWLYERRCAKALHDLSERLSPIAGVEVEFKITSATKLRRSPQSLFYHDLILGHIWLRGDENLLTGCEHHRAPETIPLAEATRLLMNRCSGLLFAQEKLEKENISPEDADFIARNIAKTELAIGDALLVAFGKYHWSCRERNQRLSSLPSTGDMPWLAEIRAHHETGVEFKLKPHLSPPSRTELGARLGEVSRLASHVWLWIEKRRLGCDFRSIADYTVTPVNKWPHTGRWRNCLANVKVFGARGLLMAWHKRHPRERILRALAYLLWVKSGTSHKLMQQVQRDLLCAEPSAIVPMYRERWKHAS